MAKKKSIPVSHEQLLDPNESRSVILQRWRENAKWYRLVPGVGMVAAARAEATNGAARDDFLPDPMSVDQSAPENAQRAAVRASLRKHTHGFFGDDPDEK